MTHERFIPDSCSRDRRPLRRLQSTTFAKPFNPRRFRQSVGRGRWQIDPFEGRLDGTVTVTPLQPPFASVFIAATGNATKSGRFSLEIPHLVNFATGIGVGTFNFTAANGDTLTAAFTGQAQTGGPTIPIVEHATISGEPGGSRARPEASSSNGYST